VDQVGSSPTQLTDEEVMLVRPDTHLGWRGRRDPAALDRPPSDSAQQAASRWLCSGLNPRLNVWLTTSSAINAGVPCAGQASQTVGTTRGYRLHVQRWHAVAPPAIAATESGTPLLELCWARGTTSASESDQDAG